MITKCKQQGVIILAMLATFAIIITGALIASVSLNKQKNLRQQNNIFALVKAKEALLGYALRQTPPGVLPCPDTDNDGFSNLSGSNCTGQLGFLPYKTLGIKESRDGSGALLWYAPELSYTNPVVVSLNSSTASALRLNNTDIPAAVILAPGNTLGSQVRINNSANSYLEGVNADGNTRTYAVAKSDLNNDDVLPILISEFWTVIEKRVLTSAQQLLINFKSTSNCNAFPWAAHRIAPYNSVPSTELGALPFGTATSFNGAAGCPSTLSAPTWLITHWGDQLLYAFCGPSGANCLSIAATNPVTANAVIIAPGAALTTQTRPSATLNNYYEGFNNDADLQFEKRLPKQHDKNFNDLLHIVE